MKKVKQTLLVEPVKQKLSGLDEKPIKATTPKNVQDAANEYFDRKQEVEKAKEKLGFALAHIEEEMISENIVVCVVRSMDGESMVCKIKSSSKLEIKKLK